MCIDPRCRATQWEATHEDLDDPTFELGEAALRTGSPYVARHEPWYAKCSPSEEQRFYGAKAKRAPWAPEILPGSPAQVVHAIPSSSTPSALLHLGRGHEYAPGWIDGTCSARQIEHDQLLRNVERCEKEAGIGLARIVVGTRTHETRGIANGTAGPSARAESAALKHKVLLRAV